jgi:hypothetical protein
LLACHIDDSNSNSISQLTPIAAGAAIGAMFGVAGAIVGAVLGLIMGNLGCWVLLDEHGCIWIWVAPYLETKLFPFPPFIVSVPAYLRIATFTLWDDMRQGNP